jgi:ubiquinone biosynthesis UbiH/UbiF/VisC/COQ6 family hydroxylase
MNYDILIIGAGPSGLCFARSLAHTGLKIAVIERQGKKAIACPSYDGREIALTHFSHDMLETLGIWPLIDSKDISLIKDAKVLDGQSPYTLHFSHTDTQKDNLGFMVSNQSIRKAAYESVLSCKNIHFITDAEVTSIKTGDQRISAFLSNGRSLSASLIVAADSRFSNSRKMMGISASMLDFGRTCIVCTMSIEKPHDQTACEMFHSDRTLALLPLSDHKMSVVVTLGSDESADVMGQTSEDFARDIEKRIGVKFGKMSLTSKLFSYPLVATYAEKFYAQRFALMGDAAVGMHPVTAHGFNLGLKGADTLSKALIATLHAGGDIGSEYPLRRYSEQHRHHSRPIYLGTNALVKLYTSGSPLARLARPALLRLGNNLSPVKRLITHQLTEIAGR